MDPITGLVASQAASQAIQGVSTALQADTPAVSKVKTDSKFDSVLRSMLTPDSANSINEEELFAALLHERIVTTKGDEAGSAFKEALDKRKAEFTRHDGVVSVEDAANAAMKDMVTEGVVSEEEAGTISKTAFQAAQLDDNKSALFDGRGSANDPTIAVMDMEAALLRARTVIEEGVIEGDESETPSTGLVPESGDTDTESDSSGSNLTSDITKPFGNVMDGEQSGFLFKPESDHGPLVVLLPHSLADEVAKVVLKDSEGNVIEEGESSGYANPDSEGDREHFRFDKPGGDYGSNITVEVTLNNGATRTYEIPDPSQRYD